MRRSVVERAKLCVDKKMQFLSRRLMLLPYAVALILLFSAPGLCNSRGGSDYGVSPLPTCGTDGPFNGVSATCYSGGGGYPDDYLFNFTLASPSASTAVTSFTIDFAGNQPDEYGLVVGPCPGGDPVPCASNYTTSSTLPFNVTGTLGTGAETFDFSGFTGDLSGMITVYFSYLASAPTPTITDITTTAVTATPEPSSLFLLLAGIGVCLALFKVSRRRPLRLTW